MSTEPSASPAPAPRPQSTEDKGKGRERDGTDGVAQDGEQAGGGTAEDAAETQGESGEKDGQRAEDAVKETPEELREQLEAVRKELTANLLKKQGIDKQLSSHESAIYAFETSYLSIDLSAGTNNAGFGNIVRGYDSYLKPGGAAADTAASRKKGGTASRGGGLPVGYAQGIVGPGGSILQPVAEEDRMFSRSSGTYLDSLSLRDRDAGVVTASEGEDEDGGADEPPNSKGNADASSSGTGQRDPKRQKRTK